MTEPTRVLLPEQAEVLRTLRAGDAVLLSGTVFTARDATHERLIAELDATGELPFGLAGQVLFYAGPTPPAAGRPTGSIGPTTARRMDAYTPRLLRAGIIATIGKGSRSADVHEACAETGSVYLVAVGGSSALLATHVRELEVVAYPELGTEALVAVTVEEFPVFVGIDASGADAYAEAKVAWGAGGDR